ncbi:ferritin-like domain-containing protein [Spirosoma endbachense]|uniref:Ferritin-like domain-containing protein n=1 Tax=Spirosoma endbachense TaxID=2666025 RepID=A0A6P1WA82_9BACT|nr:ferritin-like domain-containing protein [Spirosoma endbachense]QHW00811.1 ferritin-like domain-containing protein [Spirosoma endbachense]
MEKLQNDPTATPQGLTGKASAALGRRVFMRYLGATAAAGVVLSACHDQIVDPTVATGSARAGEAIDLGDIGSKDVNVLNYAYALEQLEAAFYTQVIKTPYAGINGYEMAILSDIRDHEIAHRELFKAALGAAAIPGLTPNFSSINFGSRASVLGTARVFEAIGVSAYNGAGKYITTPDYLLLAGKIVSVEARHTAIISELVNPQTTSFAGDDIVAAASGLGEARTPEEVLTLVRPFVLEIINGKNGRRA